MTDIEKLMSNILSELGFKCYEQCEFYPYIVDFFLPEFQIAIEADGEPWHNPMKDRRRDLKLMKKYGILVLHFAGEYIKKNPDGVKDKIMDEINRR